MPLYEYQCDTCSHRFEVIQKFSDPLVTVCPKCSGAVRKLFSSPAIQFKGSGFYITDYAKKNSTPAGSSQGEGSGEKGSGGKGSGEKGGGDKSGADKGSSSGGTTESKKSESSSSSSGDTSKNTSGSKTPTTPSS